VDPQIGDYTALMTKIFIDYAINTYKVDTSRMYVAGYSAGSCLTWDFVNHYPTLLAAVVPMSGSGGTTFGCTLKQTPSWAFEAADDPAGPYMNQVDTVTSINACNPTERARITVFASGGHNLAEEYLTINLTGLGQGLPAYDVYDQNIYDWMLAHTRPAPAHGSAVRAVEPQAFTATPSEVAFGHSTTLRWSAPGAVSCVASGDWVGERPASGTESVRPPAPGSYGYVLSCGGASQSVTLTVEEPRPGPESSRPSLSGGRTR
jgi:pimeloyl-ACP methyl ester carboxylesterase